MGTSIVKEASQQDTANKLLWSDPEFAKRYKIGEQATGPYAHDLLLQAGLQSYNKPIHLLDLACGTGIVTKQAIAILQADNSSRPDSNDKFTCADLSPEMLKVLRSRTTAESWPIGESNKTLEIVQANMTDTKLPSNIYTHLACNFGPGMAPPDKTLAESFRMLQPGGIAAWTQWQTVGWLADISRAFSDIRTAAEERCAAGTGTEDDEKLGRMPYRIDASTMINQMAGVDYTTLKANGVPESDWPRWETESYFKHRVEAAGFKDVKITVMKKPQELSFEDGLSMMKVLVNIALTMWTEDDRKNMAGVDLQTPMGEWFQKRFQEPDVKDGTLIWENFIAMVITARKPE